MKRLILLVAAGILVACTDTPTGVAPAPTDAPGVAFHPDRVGTFGRLTTPAIASPATGTVLSTSSVQISWSASTVPSTGTLHFALAGYFVSVEVLNGATWTPYTTQTTGGGTTTTTFTAPNGTYRATVQGQASSASPGADSHNSAASAVVSFTLAAPPPPPPDNQAPAVTNALLAVGAGTPASAVLTNNTSAIALTATVSDVNLGGSNIDGATYSIDGGSAVSMAATDGAFDSPTEDVTATIPTAAIASLADGSHQVCVTGTDAAGNASDGTACATLLLDRQPPAVTLVAVTPAGPVNGSASVELTATVSDHNLGDSHVTGAAYTLDGGAAIAMDAKDGAFDDGTEGVTATIAATTIQALSEGSHQLCVAGTDAAGNTSDGTDCVALVVDRTPPGVTNVALSANPVAVGGSTVLSAQVSDVGFGGSNIASAVYTVNGGTPIGMTAADGAFDSPTEGMRATLTLATGVYELCVRGTDAAGNSSAVTSDACVLLAVYDPSAGFVTGGGWIVSPAGAYAPDASLAGKATFGFVSKYQKGATAPTGNTQFQFHAGNMDFRSSAYDWLVIAGAKAQYKGTGTINGGGSYGFLLSAIDGQASGGGGVDKFRIKIWDRATGAVVYDNQVSGTDQSDTADPVTSLGGGSIQIQSK